MHFVRSAVACALLCAALALLVTSSHHARSNRPERSVTARTSATTVQQQAEGGEPVTSTTTTTETPTTTTTAVASARTFLDSDFIAIAACEQPGDGPGGVNWSHRGPTYQGGPGFYFQTWLAYRPTGAPDNAGDATIADQLQGMRNVLAAHPDAWAACRARVGLP